MIEVFYFWNKRNNQGNQLPNNLQGSTKLWIGKDYCNFIFKDVKNVHSPFQDSINRTTTPRMPWHDIAGCVYGSAVRNWLRYYHLLKNNLFLFLKGQRYSKTFYWTLELYKNKKNAQQQKLF